MLIPPMPEILNRIEAFLQRHDMPPSTFGREATGEPQLIKSMRDGRSPSHRVLERIGAYMAQYDEEHPAAQSSPDTNPACIGHAPVEAGRGASEEQRPSPNTDALSGPSSAAGEVPPSAAGVSISGEAA